MRYEDIGKSPEEIRETLDANNRLISQYAEENERLKQQLENYKTAYDKIKKLSKTAKDAVSDIIFELML